MTTGEKILSLATAEIGTVESPANSNNVKYNTWYYGRPVSGSAYPWCMAYVQYIYDKAGCRLPYITASCSALLNWYKQNRPECVVKDPVPGTIVIYNFGHTGIFKNDNGNSTITAIEGNTSSTDAGSQSNGGGVFQRVRSKSLVSGYITPFINELVEEPVKQPAPDPTHTPEIKEEEAERNTENTDTTAQEEDYVMTGKEIYDALQEYMKEQPVPDWAKDELQEAIDMGITDGTNPMMLIPRYQAAIMAKRAVKVSNGGDANE